MSTINLASVVKVSNCCSPLLRQEGRQAPLACRISPADIPAAWSAPSHAALPLRAALKTALSGLELLLARAQLWEQTAAAHVSLAGVLRPVAGLAGRWRKLELASWKGLLERTVTAFADGKCN